MFISAENTNVFVGSRIFSHQEGSEVLSLCLGQVVVVVVDVSNETVPEEQCLMLLTSYNATGH